MAVAALLACGCAAAPPTASAVSTAERDGTSMERAVAIMESTEPAGVRAQKAWIAERYPAARKKLSGIQSENGRHYDVVVLVLPDGTEKTLYFDITAYFGF